MSVQVEERLVADAALLLDVVLGQHDPLLVVAVHVPHVVYHLPERDEGLVAVLALVGVVDVELGEVVVLVFAVQRHRVKLPVAVDATVVADGAVVDLVGAESVLVFEYLKAVVADDLLLALGGFFEGSDVVLRAQVAVQFHLQVESFVADVALHFLRVYLGVAD